jgi:hypothetical protein
MRRSTNGVILAETSLAGISIVVTRDKHLLDIEETSLSMAFNDANLAPVNPAHPTRQTEWSVCSWSGHVEYR